MDIWAITMSEAERRTNMSMNNDPMNMNTALETPLAPKQTTMNTPAHPVDNVDNASTVNNADHAHSMDTVDNVNTVPTANSVSNADNAYTADAVNPVDNADTASTVDMGTMDPIMNNGQAPSAPFAQSWQEPVANGSNVPSMGTPVDNGTQAYTGSTPTSVHSGGTAVADGRRGVMGYVVTGVVTGLLTLAVGAGLVSSGMVSLRSNGDALNSIGSAQVAQGLGASSDADWSAVASKVRDSVVSITVRSNNATSQGSGAIIGTDGTIVTNAHVIEDADVMQVTLSNGTLYEAELVGSDPSTDIAVIRMKNVPDTIDLKPVTFADSDKVVQGQEIMSIGSPLGYSNTVTSGIVSAVNRPVSVQVGNDTVSMNAIQIDSSINKGNSGGPTFDANGNVIGINSSIASATGDESTTGSIGIGFSIPSNLVKKISDEIIQDGTVDHVLLGISVRTGTASADGVTRAGALVVDVNENTDAAKAGVKNGDVIVAYDGEAVSSPEALIGEVRAASPGDTAELTIVRDGKVQKTKVTFTEPLQDKLTSKTMPEEK